MFGVTTFCGLALLTLGVSAQPRDAHTPATAPKVDQKVAQEGAQSAGQKRARTPRPAEPAANLDPAAAGTPAQLFERGKAALAEIGDARASLTSLVATAKDKRDVVKVLCLDDKSSQVEAALRTTEERVDSLGVAAKHGADERARHEYLMVVTLKERVGVLMSEANQCLGEDAGFTGDSVLSVEIDANLPRVIAEVVPYSPVLFVPVSLNSGVY